MAPSIVTTVWEWGDYLAPLTSGFAMNKWSDYVYTSGLASVVTYKYKGQRLSHAFVTGEVMVSAYQMMHTFLLDEWLYTG